MSADAAAIARTAHDRGLTIAVAESLTGGGLAQALAAAPDASEWFLGGVVAYTVRTKSRVLGVPPGPVVNAPTARRMAEGVRELLGADIAAAVTGVGGPGEEEGFPPGTVYLAIVTADSARVSEFAFEGDPEAVVEQTIAATLDALRTDLG
ncbi:MAG TPA: CinA family protein [Protaetiibacter sp.]|nr:CinA family protein [Protaetiibacter sp.]